MRQVAVILTFVFAFALCGFGCSSDPSVDVSDEGGTDQPLQPPADCEPASCDDLGAACGSIDNGCGELLDCGGCDVGVCGAGERNQCGSQGECVPLTCADAGAECGPIDDGCGNSLDCGGCEGAGVVCSEDSQCIVASCGGEGKNACGTCGELALDVDTPCSCEGVATCTVFGLKCDDGDIQYLDDTDDGAGELSLVGIAELTIHEWDYDEYQIVVEDTGFAILDPEFTIAHPGGYELNVCVVMDGLTGPIEAFCDGNDEAQNFIEDGVRHGCCITLGADSYGFSSFELDFPFAPFQDYSARYTIRVAAHRTTQGEAVDSCEPYQIDYRF